MAVNAVAALWGLAEASLFFLVPDIWLSFVVLRCGFGAGLRACGWATLGALAGGASMYHWGQAAPDRVLALLDALPAISSGMIENVASQLTTGGLLALFVGPLTGTPYKLYAAQAGAGGIELAPFLLVSIPARLLRFVLIVAVTAAVAGLLADRMSARQRYGLCGLCWAGFYTLYFGMMPG